MAEKKGQTIVETPVEARGAERGPTVRNVLVWLRRLSASDHRRAVCQSLVNDVDQNSSFATDEK
jgi:hypothetical protein